MFKRLFCVTTIFGLVASGLGCQQGQSDSNPSVQLAPSAQPAWNAPGMTVDARARALMFTSVFQSFAGSLLVAQQEVVAGILALYRTNEFAIHSPAVASDQQSSMHTQLLQDTLAQLRARLPDSAWKKFLRSGLIPDVTGAEEPSTEI